MSEQATQTTSTGAEPDQIEMTTFVGRVPATCG